MDLGTEPIPERLGRPKGALNKATAEIKAVAQQYGPEAIEELVRIMRESENEKTRVSAISELLDRGYGKASQAVIADINIRHALAVRLDSVFQIIETKPEKLITNE